MEICKHKENCGGCIYQGIEYEEQVTLKGIEVLKQMQEKGVDLSGIKNLESITMQPYNIITPALDVYRYRNKMEYTFGDFVKDGEMTLGMHQKGRFMSIVTVDECQLVDEDFNIVLRETLQFCKKRGYAFYNKKSHNGLLRNLIVRKGERTKELLINIVTSSQGEFDAQGYCETLKALPLDNSIVGVLQTINENIADAVNCDELRVLYGRDYYMEKIMGLEFEVSAFSFFQT
ncbi:MAG: 23S rRNA (uracil(1939)-C(5))-methyltransferase RlmD, partial [Eubacteriales bacterium]|nr:23S rRNA (uracil(1939)-C(5))-methyltransferase RlmD [Eubacteriales bacterium]MDD4389608.1 23S rRNA (uracil(1939)-C(5))-methyltransferase RlmD [Eubacteriales bacterium]